MIGVPLHQVESRCCVFERRGTERLRRHVAHNSDQVRAHMHGQQVESCGVRVNIVFLREPELVVGRLRLVGYTKGVGRASVPSRDLPHRRPVRL